MYRNIFYLQQIDQSLHTKSCQDFYNQNMRPNMRYSSKQTQKEEYQTAPNNLMSTMVKAAIDLSSTKNDDGLGTQKKLNEKQRKSCLSHKITKIKQKCRPNSLRNMNQAYDGKQQSCITLKNEREEKESEQLSQNLWKLEDQFKRQLIYWNNFILVPNPKFKSSRFTCGGCQCTFLKIVEFVYHCLSICGQIYHIKASHFILSKEDWTNFLHEGIKKKKQMEQIHNIQRSSFQNQKNISQSTDKNFKKGTPNLYKAGKAEKESQLLQCKANLSIRKNSRIDTYTEDQIEDFCQSEVLQLDDFGEKIEEGKLKVIKLLKRKNKQIKRYTEITISEWRKNNKRYMFEYKNTYIDACIPYVIVLNPAKNNNDETMPNHKLDKESLKPNLKYLFLKHIFGKCCPINTPSSAYLILQADQFYSYLYETNNLPKKENQLKDVDTIYLKYLYENTNFSKKIDQMYPIFKYFLGFIQALHLLSDLVHTCNLCGYTGMSLHAADISYFGLSSRESNFSYEYNQHYSTCQLYNKKKGQIILAYDYKRIETELINLKRVEGYTFFCPLCAVPQKQITAEQLIKHIKDIHENETIRIKIYRFVSKASKIYGKIIKKQ